MSASNEFLQFCGTDTGTNLESQAAYLADIQRTQGVQPGIARSIAYNKAMRQANAIASQVAQYIANRLNAAVVDDGNMTTLLAQITAALSQQPTYQVFSASGTYTLPTGPIPSYLIVRAVGGGGQGGGSGNVGGAQTVGANGTSTSFGSFLTAAQGAGGGISGTGAGTFSSSVGGGAIQIFLSTGMPGGSYQQTGVGAIFLAGGAGGSSFLGGGGPSASGGFAAIPGTDGLGGGGGGGGGSGVANTSTGAGGGPGAYLEVLIPASLITAPVAVAIGDGGTSGGAAGANGYVGAPGGKGWLLVEEHYGT